MFGIDVLAAGNSSVSLSLYHKVTRVRTFEVHAGKDSKADGKRLKHTEFIITKAALVPHSKSKYIFISYLTGY